MVNLDDDLFGDCSDTVDGDALMNILKQDDETPFTN